MSDDEHQYEKMEQVITNYGPYGIFATITFRIPVTDDEGWELLGVIMTRLHRTMFGSRWRSKPLIDGVVSLERTTFRSGVRQKSSCHFHILAKPHVRFPARKDVLVKQVAKALNRIVKSLKSDGGPLVCRARDAIDVRDVTDQAVAGYIVKESREPGWMLEKRVKTIRACVRVLD